MSSFQTISKTTKSPNTEPQSTKTEPDPDYSDDEKDKSTKVEETENGANIGSPPSSTKKLTTTATLVLKSSSPLPPPIAASDDSSAQNALFSSKNMFEELKEQSAKITSAARLKFATTQQSSTDQQPPPPPVSNVKKNVAEFERKLSNGSIKEQQIAETTNGSVQPKMANEVYGSNNQPTRKGKELICLKTESLKHNSSRPDPTPLNKANTAQNVDSRRNSAIISAIAEKVAAVNQLVAEQQQSIGSTGSKSLNSSPIPATLNKVPNKMVCGSTVVVQKPVAMLPSGLAMGASATLNRRCVTVCDDPVKAMQHHQLRSQYVNAMNMGNSQTLKAKQHASLAEPATSSILKQTKQRSATASVPIPNSLSEDALSMHFS